MNELSTNELMLLDGGSDWWSGLKCLTGAASASAGFVFCVGGNPVGIAMFVGGMKMMEDTYYED